MNIKKLFIVLFGLTLFAGSISTAENFYYDYNLSNVSNPADETEIGWLIKQDVIQQNDSVLNKLLGVFKLSNQWRYGTGTSKAIYYAKMIVNLLLSFVSLISLIMLIYGFYMMFFSREESWVTKAKQIIKWVAIALFIMWLSWFIVSFIFWIQKNSAL